MILVDTNVLAYMAQPNHPMHDSALAAIEALSLANQALCLVPQVFYEYWVVATRPIESNGLGLTVAEAETDIAKLVVRFRVFPDDREVFERWYKLVVQFQVMGKPAHDARLVAAMERHGIAGILTFNRSDFLRFQRITALDPLSVAP